MTNKAGYIKFGKRSIHFIHLILIAISLFFLGYIAKGSVQSAIIAQNGTTTKGKIIDIRKVGSKGNKEYYYHFSYESKTYTGKTLYISKNIGDDVLVLFIKDNPNKNTLLERLESTYKVFLNKNQNLDHSEQNDLKKMKTSP